MGARANVSAVEFGYNDHHGECFPRERPRAFLPPSTLSRFEARIMARPLRLAAWICCVLLLALPVHKTLGADSSPPRLKRADSFLGSHFDFHAGADCTEVGKNTTPEMVENIIRLVHPDYLRIDCKGHPGDRYTVTMACYQEPPCCCLARVARAIR